jgi:hypothetical protein
MKSSKTHGETRTIWKRNICRVLHLTGILQRLNQQITEGLEEKHTNQERTRLHSSGHLNSKNEWNHQGKRYFQDGLTDRQRRRSNKDLSKLRSRDMETIEI